MAGGKHGATKSPKGGLSATTNSWYQEQRELVKAQAKMQELYQQWVHQVGEECVRAGFTQEHNAVLPGAIRIAKFAADHWLGVYQPDHVQAGLDMLTYALGHPQVYAILQATIAEERQLHEEIPACAIS